MCPALVVAAPVTFEVTGRLSGSAAQGPSTPSGLPGGTTIGSNLPVDGRIVFDSDAVDQSTSGATGDIEGLYVSTPMPPFEMRVRFGGGEAVVFPGVTVGVFAGNRSYFGARSGDGGVPSFFNGCASTNGTCFELGLFQSPLDTPFFPPGDDVLPRSAPSPLRFSNIRRGFARQTISAVPPIDFWFADFQIDTLEGGTAAIVDPNPDLLVGGGDTYAIDATNEIGLVMGGTMRSKTGDATEANVAADGVSQLLVRVPSTTALAFALEDDGIAGGSLTTLAGAPVTPGMPVAPISTDYGHWVFVVYTAPTDFAAEPDRAVASRALTLRARDPGDDQDVVVFDLVLHRPPVLFLAGLWDGPGTFFPLYPTTLEAAGFRDVFPVSFRSDVGFDPRTDTEPVQTLRGMIGGILELQRDQGAMAVARVGVVAHSLGTLIARTVSVRPGYRHKGNYGKGSIQRLVSIAGPHNGSKLANVLIDDNAESQPCGCYSEFFTNQMGRPVFHPKESCRYVPDAKNAPDISFPRTLSTGVLDLRDPTGTFRDGTLPSPSIAVLNRQPSDLAVFTVVGDTTDAGELLASFELNVFLVLVGHCRPFPGFGTIHGEDNDLIVAVSSQRGEGARAGAPLSTQRFLLSNGVHSEAFPLTGTPELRSQAVADEVVAALYDMTRFTPAP
jgi:hypothetical protein